MRRRKFITLLGGAGAAWPLAARSQQPVMPIVGFGSARSAEVSVRQAAAFRKGLNGTGYVEGRDVMVEYHWLEGQYDRLPPLMADLVRRRVAVITAFAKPPFSMAACAGTMALLLGVAMNAHEQWQLTTKAAELYQRYPARYILGPWAPLLVDAARVAAGERVLDVACGTGLVARAAAKRVGPAGRVVGVDLNPGMIAVARSLPATSDAPIEWVERSALDLRLENASFDVVLCQQGLQFFPDKAVALQEMRRVLDRGGRLALSVWNSNSLGLYTGAVSAALVQFVGHEVAARFTASRNAPTAGELQRLATEAGLFSRRSERQSDQCSPTSCRQIRNGPFGRDACRSGHRCCRF